MTTSEAKGDALEGAFDGAMEADQEGLPPPWWLNLWVQCLRERGPLNQMPPAGERCFYGNPWRGLAQELDLVLECPGLQAGESSLWAVLSQPYSDAGENALGLFERLRPQAFLWACLCEWLVNDVMVLPNESSPFWPTRRCHFIQKPNMAKYFRKNVLLAYVDLFVRLASECHLDPVSLDRFRPKDAHSGTTMRWVDAPPFAAFLLFKYLANKDPWYVNRGVQLAPRLWSATQSDQLVETPGGIKDFPNFTKHRIHERFPFAMAVDKYLFEHPHLAARAAQGGPVMPDINDLKNREPRPSADQAAHDMGIPWLHSAGESSAGQSSASRFVPPTAAMQSIAAKASLESDEDGEPWINLHMDLPQDFPADVFEMMAVIYTEARLDGRPVSDAAYGFVDTVEAAEHGDQVTFSLCIRPIFASGSWLYQAGRSARGAIVEAQLMPASWSTQGQMALGIHVVLGRLQPADQSPNSPQPGG